MEIVASIHFILTPSPWWTRLTNAVRRWLFVFIVLCLATANLEAQEETEWRPKQQFHINEVVARASNELHGKTLEAIGADRVVYPEQETGIRTAHSMFQPDVVEYMELTSDFGFSKTTVTAGMVGKTLEQAGFTTAHDRYGASVIAIKRGREPILTPSKDELLQAGDLLVIGGQEGVLERVRPR